MPDDGSRYRMCGDIYTYDELKAASEVELAELNELQGSNVGFDDFLVESLLTGTIETVDSDDDADAHDEQIARAGTVVVSLFKQGLRTRSTDQRNATTIDTWNLDRVHLQRPAQP